MHGNGRREHPREDEDAVRQLRDRGRRARLTDEHPKVYKDITVRYIFTGSELDRGKIEKAVNLSQEKYCGVSAMLGKTATIHAEIVTND